MAEIEKILIDTWKELLEASELLIDGTERLEEVGLIDPEHRQPLFEVQETAVKNYQLCCAYQILPKDI